MSSSAAKRIGKEYMKIQSKPVEGMTLTADEDNISRWQGVLSPTKEPYNKASFKFDVIFPEKYPFQPPKITFITKIYHPNVDEKGTICLRVINTDNWKPAQSITNVLTELLNMIHEPEPDHPLREDIAKQFVSDRAAFNKAAAADAEKNGIKR